MYKIASLLVCAQMVLAAESAVEKADQKVIELFRLSLMKPNRIEEVIQFVSEHEIESGNKEANLEEVISKVKEQVTGDPFIQNFVPSYENFSAEEIQYLLDVYKSDAMGKLQTLNMKLIPDLFSGIQQTIQEAVNTLPEVSKNAELEKTLEPKKEEVLQKELVIPITKEQFAKEVEQSDIPVVIDCYAKWCPPCKKMAPIFEDLSREWVNQVKFVKLDVDADPALAKELGIRSMPTFLFYKGGKLVGRQVGSLPKEDFVEKMKKFIF